MKIRDRIKSLRRVKGRDLKPAPNNWRTHPERQKSALAAILQEVGIAGALLAREVDGELVLLDGHLRSDLDPDTKWPVLILDVDEQEANKILATYDPLSSMADSDLILLANLIDGIETENDDLKKLMSQLAERSGLDQVPDFQPSDADSQSRIDEPKVIRCPSCDHEFSLEK